MVLPHGGAQLADQRGFTKLRLPGSGPRQATTLRSWLTPTLTRKGTIGQVLRSGGGKLSIIGGDPGEMRCERPHEGACH